ncbi:hypothetical protein BQ8482_130251 [Mesorhizobium delmotii]|uniref:Uncharacterized protein n=1 Tax=Mesorhizobium delmotii TaxID=1631247 RepID=A0A2P9AGU0_9HYPH|nr:hypothetical protein BQ8482_130251 [Mesorhizobium delmotii]
MLPCVHFRDRSSDCDGNAIPIGVSGGTNQAATLSVFGVRISSIAREYDLGGLHGPPECRGILCPRDLGRHVSSRCLSGGLSREPAIICRMKRPKPLQRLF